MDSGSKRLVGAAIQVLRARHSLGRRPLGLKAARHDRQLPVLLPDRVRELRLVDTPPCLIELPWLSLVADADHRVRRQRWSKGADERLGQPATIEIGLQVEQV